jgi:RND superfamily putative drug exporter
VGKAEAAAGAPSGRLDRLGVLLYRRRRRTLWITLAAVLLAGVFGLPVFGLLDSEDDFDDPQSQAVLAREDITRATGGGASPAVVALVRLPAPPDSRPAQARIDRVAAALRDRDVARVERYRPGGDRRLVSRDGAWTSVLATFRSGHDGVRERIEARAGGLPGVLLGGLAFGEAQVVDQVSEDVARAELVAFPVLLALSLFVFRGVVAALLPLAVGAATILGSFAVMRVIDGVEPMSIYALNLINGLGLGLAIDYSLFMVSRYREELERAGRVPETGARWSRRASARAALRATMATAGRTVVFSAVTVAAALASLLVFPQRFLYSMGVGGTVCALMAALVSLTLLPALLGALGHRVNALSPRRWRLASRRDARGERSGFWYRLSRAVMRRPGTVAVAAGALLLAMGLPFTRIAFTGPDNRVLPVDQSARQVADLLITRFPGGDATSLYVALRAPAADRAGVRAYAARLGRLPGSGGPARTRVLSAPARDGTRLYRIDLAVRGPVLGEGAKAYVRAVRGVPPPGHARVGGATAAFIDRGESLAARLPVALAILATTTLVILFAMTGSVILPIKALVMNLLTISAAFGLLVLIFQDGHGEALLDFTSQRAIEMSQPVLLFAVAFGLSTDYGVFLLTRVKEFHDAGLDNDEAVARGLQRTGRIVTFAALLFVIATGAFATSQMIFVKQLGVGTALAVLIDATIVRALLVPSLMKLLGERNWWAPRPLARLHARLRIHEAPA